MSKMKLETSESPAVMLANDTGTVALWDVSVRVLVSLDAEDDGDAVEEDDPDDDEVGDFAASAEPEDDDDSEVYEEDFSVVVGTSSLREAVEHIEQNRSYFLVSSALTQAIRWRLLVWFAPATRCS